MLRILAGLRTAYLWSRYNYSPDLCAFVFAAMYNSRGSNPYGQQSYTPQSSYGQNVICLFFVECMCPFVGSLVPKLLFASPFCSLHLHILGILLLDQLAALSWQWGLDMHHLWVALLNKKSVDLELILQQHSMEDNTVLCMVKLQWALVNRSVEYGHFRY